MSVHFFANEKMVKIDKKWRFQTKWCIRMVSDHIVRHHSDTPFGSEPSHLISFSKNRKNVSKKLFALLVTFLKNLKNLENLKNVSKKIVYTSRDFSQKSQKCVRKKCLHFSWKITKMYQNKNCLDFSWKKYGFYYFIRQISSLTI